MLQDIREKFIGTTGKIVLAVILLLLAGTGLNYTITPSQYIAKVNGENVATFEYDQNYSRQASRFGGQELPEAFKQQLSAVALEQTILQTALRQHLEKAGYRLSDAQVSEIIRSDPAFQVDGAFDQETYRRVLAFQNLTPAAFEASFRKRLAIAQFQNSVNESAFMTPAEFRTLIELSNQQREIEYAVLSADNFTDQVTVSDDDVEAVYDTSPTRFQTPESVTVEYVLVDDALARERVDMSEEALQAYFERIKGDYVAQEQRRARHVLLRNDEDPEAAATLAASLLARIQTGEPFADIATEYSDDGGSARQGGDLGWVSRGDFVGPVEDAVFSMQPGDLSDVVQSEFGLHIIRLDDVREGDAPTLASERADVEARYRAEQQGQTLLALQQELGNQLFSADTLQDIADAMSLEVQSAADYTADSTLPFGASDSMRDALFGEGAPADGQLSDVRIDDSSTAVVRVVERTPAGRQPLETVAETIRTELVEERALALAVEQGEQLASVLNTEPLTDFDALVANTPAVHFEKRLIGRGDAEVPAAVAAAAFDAVLSDVAEPVVGNVSASGVGFALYRLTRIVAGDVADVPAQQLEAARRQLAQRDAQAQLGVYTEAVRDQSKVKMGALLDQLEQNAAAQF
ncbi:MAG: SurA N-terminal domain-containing protein [Pseudomonadota bacterium]